MELFDIIKKRRSTRKFQDKEIETEKLDAILQAALMAPSGKRAMPWQFVVVKNKETQIQLSKCRTMGTSFVATAPVLIVVIADTTKTDVWVEDCSIAASYIQLAAESLDLGSCWAQVRNRFTENEELSSNDYIKSLLNIPEEFAVECIIALGYKNEEKPEFDLSKLKLDKIHNEQF